MTKFFKQIIIFIFINLIIYLVLLFFWGTFFPRGVKQNLSYRIGASGHSFSRFKEVKSVKNVDILFLGSSHAYRGFDPRIFDKHGYKTFNLGSSSQTPIQTNILVHRYIDNLNPKLVIYEVYPATFSLDGVESSLDIISNDKNDFYSLYMALKLNHLKTYNTLLYAVSRDILNLNNSFIEDARNNSDLYISGGYVERKKGNYEILNHSKKKIILFENQKEYFEKIVNTLKIKNIEIMFVFAPITKSLYNAYTNVNEFDSIISQYGCYYNFNEIISLNDQKHFYDSNHLNHDGVIIFNESLIDVLKKKHCLNNNKKELPVLLMNK